MGRTGVCWGNAPAEFFATLKLELIDLRSSPTPRSGSDGDPALARIRSSDRPGPLDIGEDIGSPVDFTYKLRFEFTGNIEKVTVELE
jgi:hypothetical protein